MNPFLFKSKTWALKWQLEAYQLLINDVADVYQ